MISDLLKVERPDASYAGNSSHQTGFPSPATHYLESRIDLNEVLTSNRDASFFIRVTGDAWSDMNIHDQDVLIVDRSMTPSVQQLILATADQDFKVIQYTEPLASTYTLWGVVAYIIHKAV